MLTYIYNKFIFGKINKKVPKGHFITLKILHSIILGMIDFFLTVVLIFAIINLIF